VNEEVVEFAPEVLELETLAEVDEVDMMLVEEYGDASTGTSKRVARQASTEARC
jgi:hypothetical protein